MLAIDDKRQQAGTAAWMFEVLKGIHIAIARPEMLHIIDNPHLIRIPRAPDYCKYVVNWNARYLPVFSLAAWLNRNEQPLDRHLAVVRYTSSEGKPMLGALGLYSIPVMMHVNNSQSCSLPEHHAGWQKISIACFRTRQGQSVPIVDLNTIFSDGI